MTETTYWKPESPDVGVCVVALDHLPIELCLNDGNDDGLSRGLAVECTAATIAFSAPEAAEGIAAFLERRPPRFPRASIADVST